MDRWRMSRSSGLRTQRFQTLLSDPCATGVSGQLAMPKEPVPAIVDVAVTFRLDLVSREGGPISAAKVTGKKF